MSATGRAVWNRKKIVNEANSMDILDLQRNKVFSMGQDMIWISSWSRNGKVVASISYRLEGNNGEPSGLRFTYTITKNNIGERKDFDYIIPVVSTPCNFGGKRWWYICSLIVNGESCHRRCRIVYLPPGAEYFGCRECHQLSYESRQRHREKFYERFEKPFKKVKAVQEKLSRVRSWGKKEKLWRELIQASEKVQKYTDMVTDREFLISDKDK